MSEGDESFGYEYDNDDYGGGEDEEEIEIENTYFEADGDFEFRLFIKLFFRQKNFKTKGCHRRLPNRHHARREQI